MMGNPKIEIQDIKKLTREVMHDFEKKQLVNRIGVFGSVARGDYDGESDIDLTIDYSFQEKSIEEVEQYYELCKTLTEALIVQFSRNVDVLEYRALFDNHKMNQYFREEVDNEVVWVYE